MGNSVSDRSTLVGEHMKNSGFHRGATHFASTGPTLIWSRHQAVQAPSSLKDIPKFEGPSRQGQRLEARPGARWAQKTGLETRWPSSEKVYSELRDEMLLLVIYFHLGNRKSTL